MNIEKIIIGLVLGVFTLFVFPFAVHSHYHLFADGAYFFAELVKTRKISVAGHDASRVFAHVLTQFPAYFALKSNMFSLHVLSYVYGASLYYTPFMFYMAAALVFLKGRMPSHAMLTLLLYLLLFFFTSSHIISESHVATALFVFQVSVLATFDVSKKSHCLLLVILGIVSLACYEFWVLFYPLMLGMFFIRPRKKEGTSQTRNSCRFIITALYVTGTIFNAMHIMQARDTINRNAMFSQHLLLVWKQFLLACFVFLSVVGTVLFLSRCRRKISKRLSCFLIIIPIIITSIFYSISEPRNAYLLRSLNLVLPVFFVAVVFALKRQDNYAGKLAICCVLPMLFLGVFSHYHHVRNWERFSEDILTVSENAVGFVSIENKALAKSPYVYRWVMPSLSIVTQAIHRGEVQSVLFFPGMSWEPFDKVHSRDAEQLIDVLDTMN